MYFQITTILMTCTICTFQTNPYDLTVCFDNSSIFHRSHNNTRVIDVTAGSTVHVWCHYCNSKEDYYPKLWYYKPRGTTFVKMKEIQTNDDIADNISITLSHTLNIYNFHQNNSGVYTCKSSDDSKNNKTFTYVLDGVICVEVTPKMGAASQWQEYRRTYIDSINNAFKISAEDPYKTFRRKYKIFLNVYTIWDNWGECKEIEGHTKGVRKRLGRCRIGSVIHPTDNSSDNLISYLTDGYGVPCRSLKFNELVPELSRIIINIPEFEAEDTCPIPENTARCKNEKKFKRNNIQVMENSNVTLMCNDIVSDCDIKWYKDEKLLKSLYGNILSPSEDEPHISIDVNNSLHILRISKNEEGNYTCSMNGKNVQQFEVRVVSKSKLLNQEFIRYSIYLGFVLSLTMTCYCAGVCVAWHRRASFLDPLKIHKQKPYTHLKCEQEKLLG